MSLPLRSDEVARRRHLRLASVVAALLACSPSQRAHASTGEDAPEDGVPPPLPPPAVAAPAEAEPAPPALECVPACRSGFVCEQGACISACTPPCAAGQQCTELGECVASVPRAPSYPIRAEPAADVWEDTFLVAVDLGLGAPTGLLGVELQVSLSRYLGIAMGCGTNGTGPQLMAALRLLLLHDESAAFAATLAWSGGAHEQHTSPGWFEDKDYSYTRVWSFAHWTNLDLGVETRALTHVVVRPYLGMAFLLNQGDFRCDLYDVLDTGDVYVCENGKPSEQYLYLGIAVGVSF